MQPPAPFAGRGAGPDRGRAERSRAQPSGAERGGGGEGAGPPAVTGQERRRGRAPRSHWRVSAGGGGDSRSGSLYKAAGRRPAGQSGRRRRRDAGSVGAAGGRRAGPAGDLRLRVVGQRLRLGGRCRVRRGGLPAGPGPAARPRGRAAVRQPDGPGPGHAGQSPAGCQALLPAPHAGPAPGAGEDGAAAPGLQRALRAARGPPRPLRGARQGLPRRGAHCRGPSRGTHLPAHPGAPAGLAPLAQDPGTLHLGAGFHAAEAEYRLQGHQEEAVQLRAAAHRGVLMSRAGEATYPSALEELVRAWRLPAAAVV